ncbi:MAG: NADPH:quinone oxidoreductase family protein [Jatrophihabitans sp.]
MRAAQISSYDGPGAVTVGEVPDPVPTAEQVLIEVRAAGVVFPEVLQTRGAYQLKPELPYVPGSEVAGVVRWAPPDGPVRVGDRVAAFTALGGFAELAAVDLSAVFALPDEISFEVGAALLLNYLTVHFALVRRGRLRRGDTVLVHGAAGGVGTAATQLAVALGARVIAVVSSAAKAEVARQAGATDVVSVDGFRDQVAQLCGSAPSGGVDIVVDPVGGDRFTDSLRCLRPEGRLLVIGFAAGDIPTIKVNRLLLNNVDVVGVGWGAFLSAEPDYVRKQWADIEPLVRSGAISPVVGEVFSLESAADALRLIDERQATGHVVLRIG